MDYSVDTNVIIGVLVKQDHLHKRSIALISSKKDTTLILSENTLIETRKTYKRKLYAAISDILATINAINSGLPETEYLAKYHKGFNKLILTNKNHETFYKLARDFLIKYPSIKSGIIELKVLAEQRLNLLEEDLKNLVNGNIGYMKDGKYDLENSLEIEKIISTIKFKDKQDMMIFTEVVCYSENPLEFYTDDEEFIEKGKQSLKLINKKFNREHLVLLELPK